jgi:hypothetical protein
LYQQRKSEMKTPAKKIALVTQVNNKTCLANAQLLAGEGFRVAITGPVQCELESAVECIGHGSMGLLNTPANTSELFSIYQKVTCYFGGRIDFLLLNNIDISFWEPTDISEAFFATQYALPYLDEGAVVMLNTGTLTQERLNSLNNSAEKKIRVYLERDIIQI